MSLNFIQFKNMKTKITLLFAFILTTISFAQTAETEISTEATVKEPIPFQIVEVPPLAPDCKVKWKVEKQKKCTLDFILNHVNRKLNTNLVSELGLTGFFRIDVTFTIDKEGKPKNVSASGGPEIMNQNAVEVIQALPTFTPAMHKGEAAEVYFKFPIAFDIQ